MDNRGEGVRGPEAQRMGAFEALRAAGPKAVLSHEVAAAAVGIELVDDQPRRLTVPANRSRLVVPGWRVHRFDLHPADVASVEGLRTTTPLRTVLDLVRSLEVGPAVGPPRSDLMPERALPVLPAPPEHSNGRSVPLQEHTTRLPFVR